MNGPSLSNPALGRCVRPHGGNARRSGMSILYVIVVMSVMFGFASLAMDYGRVQLAKTELRAATDSAARYGVKWVSNKSNAFGNANLAANDNMVNGQPFSVASGDVEVGYWNPQSRLFTPNANPQNAVRLTTSVQVPLALGPAIGMNFCTVRARTVAKCVPAGVVGLNKIDFKNNTFVGSYNSSSMASPTQASASGNTSLISNGDVGAKNNGDIRGDIYLGPSGSLATGWNVTGAVTTLAEAFPTPEEPAFAPSGGNPGGITQGNYTGSGTLAGGTYWFTGLTLDGNLSFTGAATIYVNGDISIGGNDLTAYQSIPSNLRIYQVGDNRTFTTDNNAAIKAVMIAPRTDFTAHNSMSFYGICCFRTIECKNNAFWFYDEAAGEVAQLSIVQ